MTVSPRLIVGAFRVAWRVIPAVPERIAAPIVALLADMAWLRNGPGVQQLQANLARVVGVEPTSAAARTLARQGMRSYARYWRELFAIASWDRPTLARHIRVEGTEHLDAAQARGAGVIVVTTHSGNWEAPAALLAPSLGGATTVAERLRPDELFDTFVAARERLGLEVLPHVGGARPAARVLRERLEEGRVIALVSERDLSRRGVPVTFFGHPARMVGGPAMLALATGAAIVGAECFYDAGGAVCRFHPVTVSPDDTIETLTQRLADLYARFIAAHPADWHMLQPIWVDEERT